MFNNGLMKEVCSRSYRLVQLANKQMKFCILLKNRSREVQVYSHRYDLLALQIRFLLQTGFLLADKITTLMMMVTGTRPGEK